jgi:hypothetical protein
MGQRQSAAQAAALHVGDVEKALFAEQQDSEYVSTSKAFGGQEGAQIFVKNNPQHHGNEYSVDTGPVHPELVPIPEHNRVGRFFI